MIIPRFTGRAIEKNDGWSFEFMVSMLGDEDGIMFAGNKIYKTKDEALKHLKVAIQDAIKEIAKEFPQFNINPDKYIDMKTNATRKWKEN
ncbi:MAG TPA: hypothetical protein VKR58_10965 [Aquella sp.]|nr:hypothetical protein [Aquella sp.]